MASHCVGLILPGMIDEPGSFSGIFNSPMPALQSQLEATRAAVSGLTSAPIVGADVLEGAARGG